MTVQRKQKLTVEEYVELEQSTDTKYEYHNGEVFALAGGSINHSVLCTNISGELRSIIKSKKKDCFAFNSEMKLNIEAYKNYLYPDAMVVCGEFKHPENFKDAITNPIIIVEVLSKSTAAYDRGEKFHKYRSIKSFQEYLLISQDKPLVEVYYRKPNTDTWQFNSYKGLEASFQLQSLQIEIEIKELYNKVNFEN